MKTLGFNNHLNLFYASPRLTFGGEKATTSAREQLLNAKQVSKALEEESPYLGELPQAFLGATGLSNQQALSLLDQMSQDLLKRYQTAMQKGQLDLYQGETVTQEKVITIGNQSYPARVKQRQNLNIPLIEAALPSGKKITLQFLGQGGFGFVYRLQIGSLEYAFKVFHSPDIKKDTREDNLHGPYKEMANGLFMTHQQTSNLPVFYAGCPQKNWYLAEYIDEKADLSKRAGKTALEQGFEFSDEYTSPGNNRTGVRVDYGGMRPIQPDSSLAQMVRALQTFKPNK